MRRWEMGNAQAIILKCIFDTPFVTLEYWNAFVKSTYISYLFVLTNEQKNERKLSRE